MITVLDALRVWYIIVALTFAFFAGSALGSGIMCLLMRRAHHRSWARGRSACDHCGHILAWFDLIPVFSYLTSHGKCRYCGHKIPADCLSSELVYGMLSTIIAMVFVFSSIPTFLRVTFALLGIGATVYYTATSYRLLKKKGDEGHG